MNKYVDPEELKNEIAKAPVWTSLTIIEIINKMTKPITQTETQNSNLTFEKEETQYEMGMGTLKCDNCSEYGSFKCTKCDGEMYFKRLEPKDEPQTCEDCKHNGEKHAYDYACDKCTDMDKFQHEDEPQTERNE